ncbi:MAG: hypothetical protein Q8O89_03270 [Nanoarchaeota archaeon]|nr:hypothetical protein [Nanoarchaeota archaeon]
MYNAQHNYGGTIGIVKEICGRAGLKLLKDEDYHQDFIDVDQYKKDLAKLRVLALNERKAIEGSSIEKIIGKFFGVESGEGLNKRLSEARRILNNLEIMTEKYANYETELTDKYYEKRKNILDAVENVSKSEEIVKRLDEEKNSVHPKLKAVASDVESPKFILEQKKYQIELDRRVEQIDKDINIYTDSSKAAAFYYRYAKIELDQLDKYRKDVRFIVDNTKRTIICGSLFLEHVDNCKNYLINGEEVLTTNMELQKAMFDIKKNMDQVVNNIDNKMEIFNVYMAMDPFKSLFTSIKRRFKLKDNAINDRCLIDEALKELTPEGAENNV